jgi:hypothetical protein
MPEFLPPVSSSSTTEYYRPVEVFVAHPPKQSYWLHIVLLLATIFTTLVVGSRMEFNYRHNLPAFYIGDDSLSSIFPVTWALQSGNILLGIPFSFTLMLILMAHEMGHYLCCRYYGVNATLPFFIPFPSLFGTMGAFIRIRAPIRSRAALSLALRDQSRDFRQLWLFCLLLCRSPEWRCHLEWIPKFNCTIRLFSGWCGQSFPMVAGPCRRFISTRLRLRPGWECSRPR